MAKKAYTTSIYTDEDYRCKGIQNVLMKKIFWIFLKKLNVKKSRLDSTNPLCNKSYMKNLDLKNIMKNIF